MKKRILTVLITLFLIAVSSFRASGANIDEYGKAQLEASGADGLSEYLDDGSAEILENLGIDGMELDKMLNVSLSSVFKTVTGIFREQWKEPVKGLVSACSAAILISLAAAFVPDDEKSRSIMTCVGGCFAVLTVFAPACNCITACISCIKLCAGFEKGLIPVLAALLTASGKPASALSFRGASLAASELITVIAQDAVLPAVGIVGALNICSGMMPDMRLQALSETIRKTVNYLLSVSAALFSGFIALKGSLASSADGLGTKAVKLVTSTFVPVVGGALSEAYTSFAGSVNIVKNSVGIFAIAAFAAIGIPVLAQTALWVLAMRTAASVSELAGCPGCMTLYNGIAYTFSMMNTVLLFCCAVFIISSATVIMTGAGG